MPASTSILSTGQKVSVYYGDQMAHGRRMRGWYRATVVRVYEHPTLGQRVDVKHRYGVATCCDPNAIRA